MALGALPLAGTAVAGFSGSAQAAYRGSEGRIAFVRSGNIYSINPSGFGLRLLAGGGHLSGPRWSPNGQRIAYLNSGNLWIMNADGSHKRQITSAAPGYTDGRPTWSPGGRYLAFVKTARLARYGYLTRYDTFLAKFVTFTTSYAYKPISVAAKTGTAVAWQRVGAPSPFAYFILAESAGVLCPAHNYCLSALGLGNESQFGSVYPSVEAQTPAPTRLTYPDWYPIRPSFATDVLTTVESCTSSGCAHSGIELRILGSLILPGAYQAVYSPAGSHIAFVRVVSGQPVIYTATDIAKSRVSNVAKLTAGSEPDWQPVAPFPPA